MIYTKYIKFLESIQTKDMWDVIPESVKTLHNLFQSKGKKLYLVGGSVRDFLTGDKPKDFDLATDALPDEVLNIIGRSYRTNLQGKAFGVVVVYTDDQPGGMEIATFREDVSRGRNPQVKLGVGIEDDVKRRDLTYNALFYDLDKREIVDLVGGIKDLESGITRMVGDAIERFEEDSLRILRAFRFASRYNHPLHPDTEKAIQKRKQLENIDPETGKMKRISAERIWEEITKAWKQAKDFNYYLNFFTKYDMWGEVFPGSKINTNLVDSKDFAVVIANLFKEDTTEKGGFHNPNDLYNKLVQEYKMPDSPESGKLVSNVVFLYKIEMWHAKITVLTNKRVDITEMYKSKVQSSISDATILEWLKVQNINDDDIIRFIDYKPSVSSKELMDKGFKGKALGDEIKRLENEKFYS